MNETLRVTAQDGVLTITLDRPKANAINVSTSLALYAAFRRLQDDDRLRVAIVTGTGRFFSAGWDLHGANDGEAIDADHGPGGFAGLTEFFGLDKPVIAAVNGLALGGGFELALADAYRTLRGTGLPAYRAMLVSQDAKEGPLAFSQKRPPVWRGR